MECLGPHTLGYWPDNVSAHACVHDEQTTAGLYAAIDDRHLHPDKAAFNCRIDEDTRDIVIFGGQFDQTLNLWLPKCGDHPLAINRDQVYRLRFQ